METITYTSYCERIYRKLWKKYVKTMPLISLTRNKAKPVVVISLEDYRSMEETAYLLQSGENAKRLLESIKEMDERITKEKKSRKK